MELLKIILINIVLLLIIAIVVLLTGQYMDNKNTEHQHSVPKIETSPIVISKELNQPTEVQVLPQKTEEEPILEPPKEESSSINELPENENVEKEPFRIPDVDDEKTVKNKLLAQNLLTDLLKVESKNKNIILL